LKLLICVMILRPVCCYVEVRTDGGRRKFRVFWNESKLLKI